MEMQKRMLLLNEEINEDGLIGEILNLVKLTFEDLADFTLAYQRMGGDADHAKK